jgi:SNF family Na+-dependent transporter
LQIDVGRYFYKDIVFVFDDNCSLIDTSTTIASQSAFSWKVFLATSTVWTIVYFCVWRGVNSSQNIVWVSVPLPFIFIIVMVIKGLTLPGSSIGLKMYLLGYSASGEPPNWAEQLSRVDMWAEAMGQAFFQVGVCMGTTLSYASFNQRSKPIIKETILIFSSSSVTGIVAGFALISAGSPVSDKVQSIGLAYVAYPAAIEMMHWSNLWAAVFALTVFFLGIDSAFSFLEAMLTFVQETNIGGSISREKLSFWACASGALCSVLFCFNWGFTLFDVIDHYICIYLLLFIGVLECFAVGWVIDFSDTVDKVNRNSVLILSCGFWVSLAIAGPFVFLVMPEQFVTGILVFWCVMLAIGVASYQSSEISFNEWFNIVALYGVNGLARKLTDLE